MEHRPERGDLYQHFKGGFYIVHTVATDYSDDSNFEEYVVYRQAIIDDSEMCIRKLSEFTSKVYVGECSENKIRDRFKFIGNVINHY